MSRCSLGSVFAAKAFLEKSKFLQRSRDGPGPFHLDNPWVNESEDGLGLLVDVHSVRKMRSNLEREVYPLASRNPKAELQVTVDDYRSGVVSFLHFELVPLSEGVSKLFNEGKADPVCLDVGEFGKGRMDGLTVFIVSLDFNH